MKSLDIIKICEVIDITDSLGGGRIKVRMLPEDAKKTVDDIPYAFPLLPKMLHIKPKVGESVIMFTTSVTDINSVGDRFYIGPIISQQQLLHRDPYNFSSRSMLMDGVVTPLPNIDTSADAKGIIPQDEEVSFLGRDKADLITRDNELFLRCGVRDSNDIDKTNVFFNKNNPSYLKMKYYSKPQFYKDKERETKEEYNSVTAVVGDRILLLGTNSSDGFNLTDRKDLITDNEINNILSKAHKLPYGDLLVDFLKVFVKTFAAHTHPYSGLQPCNDSEMQTLKEYNLNEMLSDTLRIS